MDMDVLSVSVDDSRGEMDSHADTGVGGRNTVLIDDTGYRVQVNAFSPEHEPMEGIPIGTVASAYECEDTGQTYILVWHQFLYFGDRMPVILLNGNQIRAHGHVVEDVPQQFDENSGHCITTSCGLKIPMKLKGIVSYIPMRKPTDQELAPNFCEWIDMTSDEDWDPHSQDYAAAEEQAQDRNIGATDARTPMRDVTNLEDEE
jgi:hypothetical protein